jgi:CheY-specific phosphatase CheX
MISPAISRESIETINREFWAAMAAIDLHVATATPERWNDPEGMTGRIEIRGEWNGSIEICVSWALARDAAAEMIGKASGEVSAEDCLDAVREATNIIAGGIKRLLPPICMMNVPCVTKSNPQAGEAADEPQVLRICFEDESHELAVVVRADP